MRFIIREQEYESLLAAGRLKYRSGALESWRLTGAVDGFLVMRIDLDQRDTHTASSTLFHILLDPDNRLERAKIREISAEADVSVDVLVEGRFLSVSRTLTDGVFHDEVDLGPGYGVILPSLVGMALFVGMAADESSQVAVTLDTKQHYAPRRVSVELEAMQEEHVAVTGQTLAVRPYLILRDGLRQTIWLDSYGLPVRADDDEGLQAIEDRYVRHRQTLGTNLNISE